jgi:hypothetical protein
VKKEKREMMLENFLNVNPRYISDVRKINDANPNVFEEIEMGKITLTEAKRQINKLERKKVKDPVG